MTMFTLKSDKHLQASWLTGCSAEAMPARLKCIRDSSAASPDRYALDVPLVSLLLHCRLLAGCVASLSQGRPLAATMTAKILLRKQLQGQHPCCWSRRKRKR
jgi:hypothetical protein